MPKEIPAQPAAPLTAIAIALALLLGCIAACVVLRVTRAPGPGLDPDSMSYLAAADSIAATGASFVPFDEWSGPTDTRRLRDFPPGFSAAIAVLEVAGLANDRAAVWVEAAAAFVTVAGVTWIVSAGAGAMAGVIAAVAVSVTPAFAEDHYIILSEPLFLALLVTLLGLAATRRRPAWVLGLVAGLAPMVRYAGLALPLAAATWSAITPGRVRRRAAVAALAGGPGVVGFLLWARWAGKVRKFGWKGDFGKTVAEGWSTVEGWVAPLCPDSPLRTALVVAVVTLVAVLVAGGTRVARRTSPQAFRLLAASGLFAVCYVGLVTFSRLYADDAIPFDNRLMSPLFLLATLAIVTALAAQWRTLPTSVRAAVVAVGACWIVGSAIVTFHELQELDDDGWGYASAAWIESDLKKWLLTNGGSFELFSDNAPSLFSMTHRPSRSLPEKVDAETLRRLAQVLAARPSLVVAFQEPDAPTGASGEDFARLLSFRLLVRTEDGAVFAPESNGARR